LSTRKINNSEITIENKKKVFVVKINKLFFKERKTLKLRELGNLLINDKIDLKNYLFKKNKLLKKKKTKTIRFKKDKNSLVKIQKELL
jgi:hypothetical protein